MPLYHYRITVDALEPTLGEGGLESLAFFASTPHDILATVDSLRTRLDCSACHATKLAVGLGLISEVMRIPREPGLFSEPIRELLGSLEATPAKADA
jgi:Domain of Unknown Function with PDB structure (DUF3861)